MNDAWNNPKLAQEYAEKVELVDWYEYDVNMPSLQTLMPAGASSVLDFGSGPGQFTALLAADYKVEGADASPAMIDIARKAYPDITFRQWDGQSAYSGSEKFDVIFSKLTLQFVEDLAKLAQHSRHILNDGGSLVFSVPHPIRTISRVGGKYASAGTYDGRIGKYGLRVEMIHRSLQDYTTPFIESGFVLTGLLEPEISTEQASQHDVPQEETYLPTRLNLRFKKA